MSMHHAWRTEIVRRGFSCIACSVLQNLRGTDKRQLSSGLSFFTRIAATIILRASPGKNGMTHKSIADHRPVPVLIMNHAVPNA